VDQLRVATNPKASGFSLLGHEGPADSAIKMNSSTSHMGIMEKHRPDTTFEMGQDRLFTTTGAEKGMMLHSIPVGRDQSRAETAISYSGIASAQNPSTYNMGEYMPSHNQHLGPVPIGVADAIGRGYANDADYGMKSQMAYRNNRSENASGDYFGIMGGAIGAVVAPLLDVLRPSRKENTVGTLRPYQNAKSTVSNSYIFNPADRPNTTTRETTENSKFHLNVNANQNGGAYKVTDNQAIDTNRMTTGDFYYAGGAGAGDSTNPIAGGCGAGGAAAIASTDFGFAGGTRVGANQGGPGGGGAGAIGGDNSGTVGGNGGAGYDIANFIGGSAATRGGGGGGGGQTTAGTGSGGGGNGSTAGNASNGTANTGGGGGGATSNGTNGTGGNGGSGMVWIRWKV
jgi:hypothetical protein